MNTQDFLNKSREEKLLYIGDYIVVVSGILAYANKQDINYLKASLDLAISVDFSSSNAFGLSTLDSRYQSIDFWQNELSFLEYGSADSIGVGLINTFNNLFPGLPGDFSNLENINKYFGNTLTTDLINMVVGEMIKRKIEEETKNNKSNKKIVVIPVLLAIIVVVFYMVLR